MCKVLLFNPRSANSKPRIPNSILSIAASIEGRFEYVLVDGNMEEDPAQKIMDYFASGGFSYFGCTAMPGHFKEDKTFSDFEFIISLAWHFLSVILYEPLVYRRIHKQNYSPPNWEKTMWDGIKIIEKNRSRLPSKIARNSLFRIHIDFGEKYLQRKQYRPALKQFKQAWLKQPLSFIPAKKKMAKTLLRSLGLPQIK